MTHATASKLISFKVDSILPYNQPLPIL